MRVLLLVGENFMNFVEKNKIDLEKEVRSLRQNQEFIIKVLKNLNDTDDTIIRTLKPLVHDFKKRYDDEGRKGYV